MFLEVVALALDTVRRQHHEAAAVLAYHHRPPFQLLQFVFPRRRVHDLHRRVAGDERDPVGREQITKRPASVPLFENCRKRLEAVEAEAGHVRDRRPQVIRTARERTPDERSAPDFQI
jgi:hypothetical protein